VSKILTLAYEYEHDYALIAINSTLDGYRLAYLLNSLLALKLERQADDLDFSNKESVFPMYGHECDITFLSWHLLINKSTSVTKNLDHSYLFNEASKTSFLITEKKRVDYFLKIEGGIDTAKLVATLDKIKTIKGVITSYAIDPETLKSKDYLIF